jgi:hypothetical protein
MTMASPTILYLVHPVGLPEFRMMDIRDNRPDAEWLARHYSGSNEKYTVSPVECRVVEEDK